MSHPPKPPASCNDCGRCEHCQETDDYSPAWRNPLFRPPVSADEAARVSVDVSAHESASATLLRRDGGR